MNSPWKVILATMAIFGTGVVTGGLLVAHSDYLRVTGWAAAAPPPGRPGVNAARQQPPSPIGQRVALLRRMQSELGLTPEQNERVDAIIRQGQERSRKIIDPVRPQLQEETRKVMAAFRETLTPDQRTRFDELRKQQRRARPQPPRLSASESPPGRTNE